MIEIFMIAQCITFSEPGWQKANKCWLLNNEGVFATAQLCKKRERQIPIDDMGTTKNTFQCVSKTTATWKRVE